MLTAVLVPLIVAVVVVTRVVGHGTSQVADVSAPPSSQRDQLPVVSVDVPPVTPQAQTSCPALMSKLPLELAEEQSRRVRSASPFAYAWGDPATVLICGVARPAGFSATSGLIQINGVQWYVDTSSKQKVVWTAVDRPVYVQVTVSADTDSAPVTALSTVIATAMPQQTPQPGP